ncbi:MAG: winged helix-turn-helix domain-containing protein [Candidatus Micrarchaeia archaeon]
MKSAFAALAAFLLFSLPAAEYVAHFPGVSTGLESREYAGSFGNYTVETGPDSYGAFVKISGREESAQALSLEIALLAKESGLASGCEGKEVLAAANEGENHLFCDNQSDWHSCRSADCGDAITKSAWENSLPSPTAKEIGPPMPSGEIVQEEKGSADALPPDAQGAGKETLPELETSSKQAADIGGGQTGQDGAEDSAGEAAGAESQKQAAGQIKVGMDQLLQLFAAFLAVIVASYLIIQQRPAPQNGYEVERLLSNGTRAGIMEELLVADKIPTDLSARLGKSKATVAEHLDALMVAGLVERIGTPGKKFVYYRLTHKGKQALLRRAAS